MTLLYVYANKLYDDQQPKSIMRKAKKAEKEEKLGKKFFTFNFSGDFLNMLSRIILFWNKSWFNEQQQQRFRPRTNGKKMLETPSNQP